MRLKMYFLIVVPLLFTTCAFGQKKYEKEYTIKPQHVPLKARVFIDSLSSGAKVKWYMEESLDGYSVEAKLKLNDKKYSIEFDTLGNLQDVEVQVGWEAIPAATVSAICTSLHSDYTSFQINKIQVQYTGETAILRSLIKDQQTNGSYTTKYELIVKGKKGKNINQYEITFDQNGKMENTSEIIFRNTDNLVY